MSAPAPAEPAPARYWASHTRELRARLAREIPVAELRELHVKRPWRHFLVAVRQFALLGITGWISATRPEPWIWIPSAILAGFTVFNFTVLLHEALHHCVFARRRDRATRLLSLLYAFPSGISASQFTRWHLTHHDELGSDVADPKRHYLSPRLNRRWYKLLYFTPALIPIYFRAARRETATYPEALQRTIRRERLATMGGHLLIIAGLWYFGGFGMAARVHLVPCFLVFPVAFALNRIGQHYDIDPGDPAKWGTLVKSSWFWNFLYLNSNFHLEHHYFPGVPMYNLKRLHRRLAPFFRAIRHRERGYGGLFWDYIVRNRAPHTDWDLA